MANHKEETTDDHDDAPKKKGKKGLIIILAVVLLLGGVGAGLFFSGMLDSLLGGEKPKEVAEESHDAPSGEHGEKAEEKADASAPVYFELPDVMANLNPGSATPSFIKTTITLEAPNQEVVEKLQAIQPKIQDIIITYIRELRPSDLKGSAGVYRLRDELMLRINKALSPDKINNVLFKELLIQ
jgi:flagellar protein FliL